MIAVITPTGTTMHPGTAADLIAMSRATEPTELIHAMEISNGNLCDRLMGAIQQVIADPKVTHIGIVEADMRFPPYAFAWLLGRSKDVVAANYWQRQQRNWVASMSGVDHVSSLDKVGLQRVLSVGCGVMLIRKRVFEEMSLPWFSTPWVPHLARHIGPDVYFCINSKKEIWIDHDLSQDVEHVGEVRFGVTSTRYATTGAVL